MNYDIFKNGDWGLGIGPNPQSPIPKTPKPIPQTQFKINFIKNKKFKF